MNSVIETKHGPLLYTERRIKRKKSISIRISADGEVTVSAPLRVLQKDILTFISFHVDWVFLHVGKIVHKKFGPIPTTKYFKYIEDGKREKKNIYKEKKDEALLILKKEVEVVNKIYNFAYTAIRVKNQKSRWGSCSRGGVLNFNYKVAYLNSEQRRYVIVHELCHLKEFNHGPRFWKLVSLIVPNYKEVRRGLKVI